jgi:protein AaeX
MRFVEVDLFGVYVSPIMPMMVAAWVVTITLRWIAARYGALRHVWHPALFVFAIYVVVLAAIMFTVTGGAFHVRG